MLIVRTDQRVQPTTPLRRKRPVITTSTNAETVHAKELEARQLGEPRFA